MSRSELYLILLYWERAVCREEYVYVKAECNSGGVCAELLGMDSAASPGAKLARVRRCCRHVLRLCTARAPASADDLLPALIFTVCIKNPFTKVPYFKGKNEALTGQLRFPSVNTFCQKILDISNWRTRWQHTLFLLLMSNHCVQTSS